jgi:hypothetical protein
VFDAHKSECESEEEKFAAAVWRRAARRGATKNLFHFPFLATKQERSGLMAQTAK